MKRQNCFYENSESSLLFCQCFDSLKSSSSYKIWDSHRKRIIEINKNKGNLLKNEIEIMERALDLKIGEQKKILDIGCGFAEEILEISSKYMNHTFYCMDIDSDIIKVLNMISFHHRLPLFGSTGDGCYLPYKNNTFDVVISRNFFEHVWSSNIALTEQISVLKKGGRLVIIDGNFFNPNTLLDLLIQYPKRTKGKYGGMKWLFNKRKVKENLYGHWGWKGKDEDVKSIFWWKRYLKRNFLANLSIVEITTSKTFLQKNNLMKKISKPFYGQILAICKKINPHN